MVVVILLLLLLCLSSSSMLYGLGFIPGTGNYARGSLKLNKLSLKNLDESCAIIKKVAAENPDSDNPNYFTFGGMKSFSDLLSSDEGDKVEYIYEVCEGVHRGTILTFGEFKAAVPEHHTWTCKEIEDAVQGRTAIIYDGKLISLTDAYKKIYPDLIERCSVNNPISEASPHSFDICVAAGDTPANITWDFHGSAGGSTTVADLASRWKNGTIQNAKGESAKDLGYKWVCMTINSACSTFYLFSKDMPVDTKVEDKFCGYTVGGSGIKQGIKGTCSTLNPSKIDGHPSGITWRCIDLSKS